VVQKEVHLYGIESLTVMNTLNTRFVTKNIISIIYKRAQEKTERKERVISL